MIFATTSGVMAMRRGTWPSSFIAQSATAAPPRAFKGFGDRVLINDLSFTLPRNGIVGVIGPNGVGKTTLFKTIVGLEDPDAGSVEVGDTVQLSYVDQNRENIDPEATVWEVVSGGLDYIHVGQN